MRWPLASFALACAVLLLLIEPTIAGGVRIREDTVSLNSVQRTDPGIGKTRNISIRIGEPLNLSFAANSFSYGADRLQYLLIALSPASTNMPLGAGSKSTSVKLFYILMSDRTRGSGEDDGNSFFQLDLPAVTAPGVYKLVYQRITHFTDVKLGLADKVGRAVEVGGELRHRVQWMAAKYGSEDTHIVTFRATNSALTISPRLYLRVNDKIPTDVDIIGGLSDRPAEFSWHIGMETGLPSNKFVYRYKLWPIDDDFGPWMDDRSTVYHFIPKGEVEFSVQAQLKSDPRVMSQPARARLGLKKHFVSKPGQTAFTKDGPKSIQVGGQALEPPVPAANIDFARVYGRSRALVVGLYNFEDQASFSLFGGDRIKKDVDMLAASLRANGFEVTELFREKLGRGTIMAAVDEFVNATGKDDRLLVYFSTHGFADPLNASSGYLATTDCNYKSPSAACIPLYELEAQSSRALKAGARQVLIAVDSCFSGLGVITKSGPTPNFARLATKPGAYMLTAGMADQKALIDPALGMSTFTHYLSKGLEGEAKQYDRGGVITLTDLYNYVQYNVAKRTASEQIPMLGRLSGDGEMLFKPTGLER